MNKLFFKAISAVTILIFMGVLVPAGSETVLVHARNGEDGHGWLFSANTKDGSCWIVVPEHVVTDGATGKPAPFVFEDRSNRSGETDTPLSVRTIPNINEILGDTLDIAFARVRTGRKVADCKSRLGLETSAYQSILNTVNELNIASLLKSSFGVFQAKVTRARTDKDGGAIVNLKPLHDSDIELYLKGGVSGSVAEAFWQGQLQPFSMILKVNPKNGTAQAIRFDLIRKAFASIDSINTDAKLVDSIDSKLQFSITSFEGHSIPPGTGPLLLLENGHCWTVEPANNTRKIVIDIEFTSAKTVLRNIILSHGEKCGSPVKFAVDQRKEASTRWSRAADCTSVGNQNIPSACRIALRGPRYIRLTILSASPVSISRLELN
jgi:hypothetical protein